MSSSVGPILPGGMVHPLGAIKAKGKTLFSIFQKGSPKPSLPTQMPRTGYTLIQDVKQEQRKQVFEVLVQASKDAEGIFKKIPDKTDNDFYSTLFELHTLLKTPQADFGAANKQALKLIRDAVTSKKYQDDRTRESIPAIKYIHRLVLASFIDYRPLDTFQQIGSSLMPEKDITAAHFGTQVLEARDRGQKEHELIKNDSTIGYVTKFTKCALTALKAEKLIPGLGKYDPRMDEENYPGSISEEKISRNGKTSILRTIFAASPTVGDEVAPEAKALLQALHNRGEMLEEVLKKDPYPYTHWTYTSFQNLEKYNEGARAHAIMNLNDEFRGTFTGLTLSLDSPFFLDGVHGKDEEEITRQKIEHGEKGLTDKYADEMYNQILTDKRYRFPMPPGGWKRDLHDIIQDAKKTVSGIGAGKVSAFPLHEEERVQKAAEKAIPRIRAQLNKMPHVFKKIASVLRNRLPRPSTPLSPDEQKRIENWEKKAAFRELVVLGLIRYWQLKSAPAPGVGLTTCACKESVDRGAQINSALLWALGDGSRTSLAAAFNLVQGKALADRNRLVLLARLAPAHALWKHVPQKKAHEFLMGINNKS